jgi:Protein of unknown function (DUF3168)
MIEAQRVASFVFDTLKADSAFSTAIGGRLYRSQVPQAATLPAGIVRVVSWTPTKTLGGLRVKQHVLIDVHLIAAGASYGPINTAADRVDAVLANNSGVYDGVIVVELTSEPGLEYVENESGTTFSHLVQSFSTDAYQAS